MRNGLRPRVAALALFMATGCLGSCNGNTPVTALVPGTNLGPFADVLVTDVGRPGLFGHPFERATEIGLSMGQST